jgi:tetratricopeptide (TPR) repeat protein
MNPNLERGILLYQQSRHELAEEQLRQSLATDPHDSYTHALLALCLTAREQFDEATNEARLAVHLGPDFSFAHYALAKVYYDRNRRKEALEAIEQAIQLDSTDSDYFAMLSTIHFEDKRWEAALNAAEQGLEFDPEHVACTNLRAMALVKLGRKAEAGASIETALAKNPENSSTHANQGWMLLEQGDPKRALEHFREAIRLDPENDWARAGIVEALKARNFIYAVMLKYFLWMSKLSPRAQWGILVGGVFGIRILGKLGRDNPELMPFILPVRVLYVAFALMTWIADPLFNLMLRLNRFGRLALSREQVIASNWIGACLVLGLFGLGMCARTGFELSNPWLVFTMVFGFLLIPIAGTFRCNRGWPRNAMAIYTGVMALFGVLAVTILLLNHLAADPSKLVDSLGMLLFLVFLFGAMGSGWAANILIAMRPKR